jgi:hypothetical protein
MLMDFAVIRDIYRTEPRLPSICAGFPALTMMKVRAAFGSAP